ncbi:MAG: DUF697 domain-containing protein [Bacteroidaceae bacterium]|nr:DUF697 domain-containing protein [Bacteroidaceae bacterium]
MKLWDLLKGVKSVSDSTVVKNITNLNKSSDSINFKELIDEAIRNIGHANIIIAGKTGVGKSTLVNAVFNGDLAETGVGHPVTSGMKEYSKDGEPVHIFDTKGFELSTYRQMAAELHAEIKKRKHVEISQQIHLAWYCISDEGKRVEEAEIEFINLLAKDIPVVVVMTKSVDSNLDFYKAVKNEDLDITNVIRVLALPYSTPIGTVPSFGLDTLIEHTYQIIPDAAKIALASSQKVNNVVTKKAIDKVIALAAASAVTVGAVPIPFSDAAVLAPIQIGMIASISKIMKIDSDKAFLTTLVSSAAGVVGATITGRAVVSGLLKCIPGAGSIIGGTISAATAGVITTTMGYSYYKSVTMLQSNGDDINPSRLSELFIEQLRKSKIFKKD